MLKKIFDTIKKYHRIIFPISVYVPYLVLANLFNFLHNHPMRTSCSLSYKKDE